MLWLNPSRTGWWVTPFFFFPHSLQSVHSLSHVQLFEIPWTAARQASLSITNSQSSPTPMSIESVMPSNHLILCRPLLLLPSIFPSIGVFSNESTAYTYWEFAIMDRLWSVCLDIFIHILLIPTKWSGFHCYPSENIEAVKDWETWKTTGSYCIAQGTIFNILWQIIMEKNMIKNIYMCKWVTLLYRRS